MKILVVDDSVVTLSCFQALFEVAGHVVFVASNVPAALTQLEQRSEVNLILCDYYMPEENGFSLCTKIRSMGVQTPIIMLTAAGEDEVNRLRGQCNMLGNIMVMRKPVEPEGLVRLLADVQPGKFDGKG